MQVDQYRMTKSQALPALIERGQIAPSDRTVLVLTGSGLKAGARIAELL